MLERAFGVPDPDMFESGRTMRQLFLDHKAPFVALDVSVDDPYAADWLTSIETSEGVETDETRTDQQMSETAEVLEQMGRGRKKYIEMKYYIEGAFESSPAIKNKFGLNNYDEAANNQPRMITFLKNLHTQSEVPGYKAELLAHGCTQPQIDEILTIHDSLAGKDTAQNTFIQESPEATKKRITQYNTTYGFAQKINRLSKVVYYGDPVMLNTFNLPEGPGPDPDINVKGKATDAANGSPLKGVAVKIIGLDITTTTNAYGNFHFVSIPAGIYKLEFKLTGYTTLQNDITVLASGVVNSNAVLTVV